MSGTLGGLIFTKCGRTYISAGMGIIIFFAEKYGNGDEFVCPCSSKFTICNDITGDKDDDGDNVEIALSLIVVAEQKASVQLGKRDH